MERRSFLQLLALASTAAVLEQDWEDLQHIDESQLWAKLAGIDVSRWLQVLSPPTFTRDAIEVTRDPRFVEDDKRRVFIQGILHTGPAQLTCVGMPRNITARLVRIIEADRVVDLQLGIHKDSYTITIPVRLTELTLSNALGVHNDDTNTLTMECLPVG